MALTNRIRMDVRYLIQLWPVSTLASIWYLFTALVLALSPNVSNESSLVYYISKVMPGDHWWTVSLLLALAAVSGLWFALSDSRKALFATVSQQLVMVATLLGVGVAVATGQTASGEAVSRGLLLVSFMPVVLIIVFHALELVMLMRWRFAAGRYRTWTN